MTPFLHSLVEAAEESQALFSAAARACEASTGSSWPADYPEDSRSFHAQSCDGGSGTRVFHLHYPPSLSTSRCCLAQGCVGASPTLRSLFSGVGRSRKSSSELPSRSGEPARSTFSPVKRPGTSVAECDCCPDCLQTRMKGSGKKAPVGWTPRWRQPSRRCRRTE